MAQQNHHFSLHNNKVSIHRVPSKLRKTDPKSYEPHFISIGPYHHGAHPSETLKYLALNRLINLHNSENLNALTAAVTAVEHQARECYSDEIALTKTEFVNMLLLDGCFIIELFLDLNRNNFAFSSLLTKRWMLPVVRRDLITLENQIPMIVLEVIFDQIRVNLEEEVSVPELALRFFDPLMPRESKELLEESIATVMASGRKFEHLLDVFHSSIALGDGVERKKEPHMYRSAIELREAGVKVRALDKAQPLEIKFEKNGKLMIPSLLIDNHTGSFFRNIVAYEQCHHDCKPDMTTYLFFLDKLINSAEDVGLLHFEGVIQHTLGSNKQVAKLVNNLCLEIENDGQESYLYNVIERLNSYSNGRFIKVKTRLKQDYFTNIWVTISTLVALLLLYLTLLQSSCDAIEAQEKQGLAKKGYWVELNKFLLHPLEFISEYMGRIYDPEDPTIGSNEFESPGSK